MKMIYDPNKIQKEKICQKVQGERHQHIMNERKQLFKEVKYNPPINPHIYKNYFHRSIIMEGNEWPSIKKVPRRHLGHAH